MSNGVETKSSLMFVTSISNALLLVWWPQLAKSVRAIAARVAFFGIVGTRKRSGFRYAAFAARTP